MTKIADSLIPSNPSDYACIDLVNSYFTDHLGSGQPVDRLADSRWLDWFLEWHGLKPTSGGPPQIGDLARLRTDVRRLLEKWARQQPLTSHDARVLDVRIRTSGFRYRVAGNGADLELRIEPLERDGRWVMAELGASVVELFVTGDRHRLKVCANPACSWMFYDATLNGSRKYCSTTPCATLVRVRKFRMKGDATTSNRIEVTAPPPP